MTIEHADKYLDKLRKKSPSVNYWGDWEHDYTKPQAKKLAKPAASYWQKTPIYPPSESDPLMPSWAEWQRFSVRIYDESIRLRAIGEGRR